MLCPSQPEPPYFDVYWPGVHYSFRYNSWRAMWYGDSEIYNLGKGGGCYGTEFAKRPPKALLTKANRIRLPLFSDAANCRRDDGYNILWKNVDAYRVRWAHMEGGFVATHAGYVTWVPNVTPPNPPYSPGWPRHWYSWYGCGWTNGIDNYVK